MSMSNLAPWDRPLEQWKVTELKEELKRRKLITRGLKEELVRRLDEAVRREAAETKAIENGFDAEGESHGMKGAEIDMEESEAGGDSKCLNEEGHTVDVAQDESESPSANNLLHSDEKKVDEIVGSTDYGVTADKNPQCELGFSTEEPKPEASLPEDMEPIDSSLVSHVPENVPKKTESSAAEPKDEAPTEESQVITSKSTAQVSETVHQVVKCEYVSTDYVSIKQENKLKDNLNTDSVPVELEAIKTEVLHSLSSDNAKDGASVVVHEDGGESMAERREVSYNMDIDPVKKDDSDVHDDPNLNETALEEPIGQEATENKNSDITSDDNGGNENIESQKSVPIDDEKVSDATTVEIPVEEKYGFVVSLESFVQVGEKRKTDGVEVEVGHEPAKRQRKWNTDPEQVRTAPSRPARVEREPLNLPDTTTQMSPVAAPCANALTPRDKIRAVKVLARSDSNLYSETPMERVVPPSQRSPTMSLRIDKFLRPFTLKAVQELLAKTGKVCSFWMDHIKTHCYVTYSSVDEAVATRNALYNLQWPPNGGRCLTADFVEPEDVKARVEGGQQPPIAVAPPSIPPPQPNQANALPSVKLPPPPALPVSLKQQLPPPPPLAHQTHSLPAVQEKLPPPPPPKKVEATVLTLDDLFKKTRATPRIYYLPLSEEQVAAKLAKSAAVGRNRGAAGQPQN